MYKGLLGFMCVMLVVAFAGCGSGDGGSSSEAGNGGDALDAREAAMESRSQGAAPAEGSETIEATAAPAAEAQDAEMAEETAAPAAEAPAEEAAAEAEAPAEASDGLAGTKWTHNGINLEFKEGNVVHLSGGPLASLAPNGQDANYTLADGAISVEVFGQVYSGTWDGTKLIVDGSEAEKTE